MTEQIRQVVYARWFLPLVLLIVVVVATTVVVVNQINRVTSPSAVVIKITNGPTVISTQVVPLR